MWLALVFYCTTPLANSCEIMANTKHIFNDKISCEVDASEMAMITEQQGLYARWACIKLGDNTQ